MDPQQPIQIQLPPALTEMMQQWPTVLTRVAACEAPKPSGVSTGVVLLVALAACALGVLALIGGQWAWAIWGV